VPGALAFKCEASARREPDGLRRLSMTQYQNTVRDLVRWALGEAADLEEVLSAAGLASVPRDRREPTPQEPRGGYRRLDQAVDQAHVDETLRVASALAGILTSEPHLSTVVGRCAGDADASNDEACLSEFIQRFGERALRRALDEEDESFYRAVYGGDFSASPAAYADVITVMLSAPEFLYFVEHAEDEVRDEPGSFRLSAYELASRLAYHFWQTLPDDELWRAAEDESLLEPEVLTRQAERLLADPRARAALSEFFSDWLGLDELPQLDARAEDPVYAAFAGADLPGPALRQQVIDDALDMLEYFTWSEPRALDAMFSSELSFARGPQLAHIYGVAPWDGSSRPRALPSGVRPGLLTRAWFLAGSSANTRPIQRGAFVRRRLLCDEIPPPPDNVAALPPALAADKTTRQVVSALTEQPGSTCAGCHASLINPLGYAFEGFDALGRARAAQPLFGSDGAVLGSLPVDTRSVPRVTAVDARASAGPAELASLLLESGKLEACFVRNYFRFTFGRAEDLARDGCALERLRARLLSSGRVRDMFVEAALLPELQRRRFEP
jgi:hypothetical protein